MACGTKKTTLKPKAKIKKQSSMFAPANENVYANASGKGRTSASKPRKSKNC